MVHRILTALTALFAVAALSCDALRSTGPDGISISIEEHVADLEVGASSGFTAVVRDRSGTQVDDREVFWASEDETIARVGDNGMVTAVAPGETRIAASVEGQSDVVALVVVPVPVAAIELSPESVSLRPGGTQRIEATLLDRDANALADRDVAWASDDEDVATVSGSGLVTAESRGEADITATSEGVSATARVRVGPASGRSPATVTLTPASVTVSVDSTVRIQATALDADGEEIGDAGFEWTSANESIATVDGDGEVEGVGAGTTEVRASSGGQSGAAEVTVSQEPEEASGRPSVRTRSATNVTATGARLRATVNGNGSDVFVLFEYARSEDLSSGRRATDWLPLANNNRDVQVPADVTGLEPGTRYYFRVVAMSSEGSAYGDVESFTTAEANSASAPAGSTPVGAAEGAR